MKGANYAIQLLSWPLTWRNPTVSARFRNIEDRDHVEKMAAEFFCAGCGGPDP